EHGEIITRRKSKNRKNNCMTQNRHYTEKSEKKVSVYKGFISALLYSIGEVRRETVAGQACHISQDEV
ncbi:MAG: hypothetical protein RR719_01755, partial [Akkermansia sp.]